MKVGKYNKITLETHEIKFIHDNYNCMTNLELAIKLGLKITRLRYFLSEMGLKRMEMEYWTKYQTQFLIDNYKEIGDTELAEIFEVKWKKNKGWTKKHIEKKRRYLKLKRTEFQKKNIKERNRQMGRFSMCAKKRWETTGQAPIGEKRVWFHGNDQPLVVIKIKNGFVHFNRWLWEKERGPIPKGMNVRIIGEDKINYTIDDLILITDSENAKMNTKNRVPIELRETINMINKLNRQILK